jgi:hypothetical protein
MAMNFEAVPVRGIWIDKGLFIDLIYLLIQLWGFARHNIKAY